MPGPINGLSPKFARAGRRKLLTLSECRSSRRAATTATSQASKTPLFKSLWQTPNSGLNNRSKWLERESDFTRLIVEYY